MSRISDLIMIIKWNKNIVIITKRELGKLISHSAIYCTEDDSENILNFRHTLDRIYVTNILHVQCFRTFLHNDGNEFVKCANKRIRPSAVIICTYYRLHDDIIKWKHFSALLAICAGNPLVTFEFPAQRPVAPSFNVSFDLRLNKRLSKQ